MAELRFGLGFDSHPRDPSRPLWLGGVSFPGEPGLAGHSDADVVCHALADALLGAAGLGDIGQHFPDTDPRYEGMGGLDLLARTVALVRAQGLEPSSCDLTLIAERPALAPRRDDLRRNLGAALGIEDPTRVSVKAHRPEGLGLTGDGAACLALAVLAPR
ncbi:MAG: 2-C-methyl-D-erythritol 2,4-cyclodiphosphate synthase [Actinomycetota bacterium]|nr:2-C-methyl-D-erythritol 2,4-cyclodiphosphate synthase [Actinomycetota bacterium]